MPLIKYLIIAIALSMDTFSLSLGLTLLSKNEQLNIFPILVGILHFMFPLLGRLVGINLLKYLPISPTKLLGIIFMILFIKLLKDIVSDKDLYLNINFINIIVLAVLVSIDSLITGIGLTSNNNFLTPYIIFSIVSFTFTFIGLKIGKYAKKELENIASLIGLFLLFVLSIIHLCK